MSHRLPPALVLLLCAAIAACGRARVDSGSGGRCAHVQATRQVRGVALCEDVWSCERPPGGPLDTVSLTRLAPCGNLIGPLVLYLPDRHQHGDVRSTNARTDLRLYLGQAGIRTWALGYRTHTRTLAARGSQAPAMDWDFDTFADDVQWAMRFIRGTEPSRGVWLAAAGDGATFAYEMARRGEPLLAGIVALDGAAVAGPAAGGGRLLEGGVPGLAWDASSALLDRVQTAPRSASPVSGYPTAEAALSGLLFVAPAYGGNGGLSAARDGASSPSVVARYLAGEDRWWPRSVLRTRLPGGGKRAVPVLAFAAGRRGEEWARVVRESAQRFGGDQAVVQVLAPMGHLDVLVGRAAPHQVHDPVRVFVTSR